VIKVLRAACAAKLFAPKVNCALGTRTGAHEDVPISVEELERKDRKKDRKQRWYMMKEAAGPSLAQLAYRRGFRQDPYDICRADER
jgi:hypothetical protein